MHGSYGRGHGFTSNPCITDFISNAYQLCFKELCQKPQTSLLSCIADCRMSQKSVNFFSCYRSMALFGIFSFNPNQSGFIAGQAAQRILKATPKWMHKSNSAGGPYFILLQVCKHGAHGVMAFNDSSLRERLHQHTSQFILFPSDHLAM